MNEKKVKKNIDGILLLDKPFGESSNSALQKIKRLYSAKKAGHTGSLDPLATGMLPICFGEATKFSQFLLESDKNYRVTIKLGVKTTTGDAEGSVIQTRPVENITRERVEMVLQNFLGNIQQIPPMYSAIKHQGKPLYELARQGIEIERAARSIKIYSLDCDEIYEDRLVLDVHCSKGTYVRTLAEDIGEALGCGAHVAELCRVSVTPYQEATMYSLETLEKMLQEKGHEGLNQLLLPIESSVGGLATIQLSTSAVFYVRMGQPVMVPNLPTSGTVRLYAENKFLGVGEILSDGRVAPRRLVAKYL